MLLAAALAQAAIVKLSDTLFERVAAAGAALVNLFVLALFVGFVVLAASEVYDGCARRGVSGLLRGARSTVWRLLLVGVAAGLAIGVVSSLGSIILVVAIFGAAFAAGTDLGTYIVGALLMSILVLVPELLLLTVWSVCLPVAVLERPGGLRALGRSRDLVRGNGWRVLAWMLAVALPLSLVAAAADNARHLLSGVPAIAGGLLVVMLIAPIPVLAVTALYYELRSTERATAPAAA
jgi:hypothetical protein